MREPLDPANLDRWIMLGLANPELTEITPATASTADILALAILCPGAEDPVEGMVNGTRAEFAALASLLEEDPVANLLGRMVRQLDAAMALLRRTDRRDPSPADEPKRERGDEGDQPPKSGEIASSLKPEVRS